jgi:hypothetical protein
VKSTGRRAGIRMSAIELAVRASTMPQTTGTASPAPTIPSTPITAPTRNGSRHEPWSTTRPLITSPSPP